MRWKVWREGWLGRNLANLAMFLAASYRLILVRASTALSHFRHLPQGLRGAQALGANINLSRYVLN